MITPRSLCIAIALAFVAQAQQPSGTPQCTASCPAEDLDHYQLGTDANYNYKSGGVLFCSYPTNMGDDPYGYYCTYDSSTGVIITAHDITGCPPTADESCVISRRFKGENNYTAMLRKKREAAAMPQPSEPRQPFSDPFKLKARKPSASPRSEADE
ncbi:hypothetical protein C8R45DRAFT_440697 [Mycena sanguinolenta]|nr:hypothetical protein C8R45DRAFT_440697 [Mycena sanguinolenta]